jgi:hypothetical protein
MPCVPRGWEQRPGVRGAPAGESEAAQPDPALGWCAMDKLGRAYGSPIVVLVSFVWMPALWLYKTGRYPHFESLWLPAALLAAALFSLTVLLERLRARPLEPKAIAVVLAASALGAGLWVPVLNGALAFGEPVMLDGVIEVKSRPGRGGDRRYLSLEHGGRVLRTEIDPVGFWQARAVREGGPCRVALRRGALGAPWPQAIHDP